MATFSDFHAVTAAAPPAHVGAERLGLPVIGQHPEPPPGADHRVRGVLGAVHALVVSHVGHVPGRRDVGLRLDVGQADRQPRLSEQPGDPHGRPVCQHDDQHAVEVRGLERPQFAFRVLAVLHRLARDELAHIGQVRGDLGSVTRLPLRYPGDHFVIEVLHDSQDPDARLAVGHRKAFLKRVPAGRCRGAGQRWP
jgi:hypothetical protein